MKKIIDLIKFKIGMWIAFKPHNKTATEAMHEIQSRAENQRCVHCGKNPYFKDFLRL